MLSRNGSCILRGLTNACSSKVNCKSEACLPSLFFRETIVMKEFPVRINYYYYFFYKKKIRRFQVGSKLGEMRPRMFLHPSEDFVASKILTPKARFPARYCIWSIRPKIKQIEEEGERIKKKRKMRIERKSKKWEEGKGKEEKTWSVASYTLITETI